MAHNTGPPLCKVCGHPHRWVDEHIWLVPAEKPGEKDRGPQKTGVAPAVLDKTLRIKAEREAAEAEKARALAARKPIPKPVPKPVMVKPKMDKAKLEALLARDSKRRDRERAKKARQRSKRAAFRHQGR